MLAVDDMTRKGDKGGIVDFSDKIGHRSESLSVPTKFKPQVSYADKKMADSVAIKAEIEDIYALGMSKLYDKEEMEFQKLNALMK